MKGDTILITIIAIFELKPECVETFKGLAAECIEASRKEEGNVSYNFYTGKEDKNKYFFVEVWKDAIGTACNSGHEYRDI